MDGWNFANILNNNEGMNASNTPIGKEKVSATLPNTNQRTFLLYFGPPSTFRSCHIRGAPKTVSE